jgi:hypothetical protein
VETAIIGEVRTRPPDRVAILTRDVREYGYRGFGVDYDRRLLTYVAENYRLERRWTSPRFQLLLLRRGH